MVEIWWGETIGKGVKGSLFPRKRSFDPRRISTLESARCRWGFSRNKDTQDDRDMTNPVVYAFFHHQPHHRVISIMLVPPFSTSSAILFASESLEPPVTYRCKISCHHSVIIISFLRLSEFIQTSIGENLLQPYWDISNKEYTNRSKIQTFNTLCEVVKSIVLAPFSIVFLFHNSILVPMAQLTL